MPPHLAPMFNHTIPCTTEQDHEGQPAANQAGMDWCFHNWLFYTNKGRSPFVLKNYMIYAFAYKIFVIDPNY
jgi:hypothetical protein